MTTDTDTPLLPCSLALNASLQQFAAQLHQQTPSLSDGVLTARVVGEFSAGKTRLLRELMQEWIPPALFPLSSLERQTRLPLEITYGDTPVLSLIRRERDFQTAEVLDTLDYFPGRDELQGYDPFTHRLRLAIPESRLILPGGDGFTDDTDPKRLFLIDTPGWNSGEDALADDSAQNLWIGHHNLALVYVSHAARLDSQLNADRLQEFMQLLVDADFLQQPRLLFVLTHCPRDEAERARQRIRDRVEPLWQATGGDIAKLELHLFCLDFQTLSPGELDDFRKTFWSALLGSVEQPLAPPSDPWVAAIRQWPDEWQIDPYLHQTHTLLQRARTLLQQAVQADQFVAGMNTYRLIGLDETEMRAKVRQHWLRQLDCEADEWNDWQLPVLAPGHPLAAWWEGYWLSNLEHTLNPIQTLFRRTDAVISQLPLDTPDLQAHLQSELASYHAAAIRAGNSSFTRLIDLIPLVLEQTHPEQRLATLFSLVLLEARYADYRERYMSSGGILNWLHRRLFVWP